MVMTTSTPNPKRQRRDERPLSPTPIRETHNVITITTLVYSYGVLSQKQLERLLGLSRSVVQRLCARMYRAHYLNRVFKPVATFGAGQTFYVLDKKGVELLTQLGIGDLAGVPKKNLSELFLNHAAAINDFRIEMTKACEAKGWSIAEWIGEGGIKQSYDHVEVRGYKKPLPVVPDSFFVVKIPGVGVSPFVLEVDRGKMELARYKAKIAAYVEYYKSGRFQKRFGFPGFKLLTVVDTPGKLRVQRLIEVTQEVTGIGQRCWFVHLSDVSATTVLTEPVWTVAGRGKSALFDLEKQRATQM